MDDLTFTEAVDEALADSYETGERVSVFRHHELGWSWQRVA